MVSAVSRQHILKRCKDFREDTTSNFRPYRQAVKDKREPELLWSKQIKDKMRKGSDIKKDMALMQG